jgi:ribosomal RNA-processing protein 17
MRKRGTKREVVFDPEARKAYLRGFSERKRQRRAFGLAMQKVKDRKAKLEQRAQEKKDELERVEQAEAQKEELMEEVVRMNPSIAGDDFSGEGSDLDKEESSDDEDEKTPKAEKQKLEKVIDTKVYDDSKTELSWGGQVTVTTSVVELDGDSCDDVDDDDLVKSCTKQKTSVDLAQKYAGNVNRFLNELKGNMPAKHKRDATKTKRKGKNGAADMKGVGGAQNLKIASKLLSKSKEKNPLSSTSKKGKRKRR